MKTRSGLAVLCTVLALQAGSASALTVRSADILDGEVKNVDIGANAVTTDKILDFTVGTDDIANSAITSGKIAAGAVDDSKITGPISAAKINSAGLNADTVDGMHAADLAPVVHDHDAVYQKKYANVIVVAKSGADFTDPVAAANSISDASSSNPHLIKIMPGVYDIGAQILQMKEFVEIQGSGTLATVIKASPAWSGAAVRGADSARLADLTIEHQNWTGILNDGVSPMIDNVRIMMHANTNGNGGIANTAISNLNSQAVVKNTSIISEGFDGGSPYQNVGVYNAAGSPRFENLILDQSGASFGMFNYAAASVTVESSTIRGANIGIQSGGELTVRNSKIEAATGISGAAISLDHTRISAVVCIECSGGAVYVNHSEFRRTEYPAMWTFTNNCTAFLNNTLIVDGTFTPGIFTCRNVFDAEYNTITCP